MRPVQRRQLFAPRHLLPHLPSGILHGGPNQLRPVRRGQVQRGRRRDELYGVSAWTASARVRPDGMRALRARPRRFGRWASYVRPVRRGHVQRGRRSIELRRLRARVDSARVGSERMRAVRGGEICLECHRMQQLPAIRRGAHEPPRRGGLRHLRGRLLLRRPELP